MKRAVSEADLGNMTLVELRALRAQIEEAIRAGIRAQRTAKAPAAAPAAPVVPGSGPQPVISVSDLERERDNWLSSRR